MEWYRLMDAVAQGGQGQRPRSSCRGGRLPNDFVDVAAAFERLRQDFELVLRNAYDSAPVEIAEGLGLTEDTRKHLVCGVAQRQEFCPRSDFSLQ